MLCGPPHRVSEALKKPKPQQTKMTGNRISVSLACAECGARNYKTDGKPGQVVELKKFCKTCKKHTIHRHAK